MYDHGSHHRTAHKNFKLYLVVWGAKEKVKGLFNVKFTIYISHII